MAKTTGLGFKTPDSWGNRSALGGTYLALKDVRGNRDGLWGNEDQMAGQVGGLFARQPLALRAKATAEVGLRTKDEIRELEQFRAEAEAKWGVPTVAAEVLGQLRHPDLYAAQKAIVLSQLGRAPSEVNEHIVRASGSVANQSIEARDVFTQLWAAKGTPSGRVVVLSPGFQETWRDFVDVVDKINANGHDVLVMDHQWSSETDENAGGMDRGNGVARDVASVMAKAAELARERHGEDGTVILAGNSMGGGPGAAGAAAHIAAGTMALDGAAPPTGVPMALFDPFFGATPNFVNDVVGLAARVPVANRMKVPSAGLPDLTDDKTAEQRGAQNAVLSDARAQLSTMTRALPDIAMIRELARENAHKMGPSIVVHAERDTLADPAAAKAFAKSIGAEMRSIDSSNHVHQLSPTDQQHLVDAIETLATPRHGTVAMPRMNVTLRAPLEMKVSGDLRSAKVRYAIPMDDLDTQPLGDRRFADAIDTISLGRPFVRERSDDNVTFSVEQVNGEATLILEADVVPSVFEQLAAPFSIILDSGQHVLLTPTPETIAYDMTAAEVVSDRSSLENKQSYRAFQQERLGELEHLLANPDEIRTGTYLNGRPAREVRREELAQAKTDHAEAKTRVAELRTAIDQTWAKLDLREKHFAMRVVEPFPADDAWPGIEADLASAYETFLPLDRDKARLTKIVEDTQHLGGEIVGGYRRELIDVTRAHAQASRTLEATIDTATKRFETLGQMERFYTYLADVYPPDGEAPKAYRHAEGSVKNNAHFIEVFTESLRRLEARAEEQHAALPAAIEKLNGEIAETDAAIADLEQQIANPTQQIRTRPFQTS
ncbi:MAG: alpha/beta fold hydrolase [Deltaproteobacteria bacterium]